MRHLFVVACVDLALIVLAVITFVSAPSVRIPVVVAAGVSALAFNFVYLFTHVRYQRPTASLPHQPSKSAEVSADQQSRKQLLAFGIALIGIGVWGMVFGTIIQAWGNGWRTRDVVSLIWRTVIALVFVKLYLAYRKSPQNKESGDSQLGSQVRR